jgi:hypothetical protein
MNIPVTTEIVVPEVLKPWGPPVVICNVSPYQYESRLRNVQAPTWDDVLNNTLGMHTVRSMPIYRIGAAPPGGFALTAVWPGKRHVYSPQNYGDSGESKGHVSSDVSAAELAMTLVTEWSGMAVTSQNERGRGVGVIAGLAPTREELDALTDQHRACCEQLVMWADEYWQRGASKNIVKAMHDAANFLHITRDWLKSTQTKKACPACRASMHSEAVRCGACSTDLATWYEAVLNRNPAYVVKDAAVAAFMTELGILPWKGSAPTAAEIKVPPTPKSVPPPAAK